MMRERKNPLYLKASIIFHALCVLGCLFTQQYVLSLAFVPALIRAIYLPTKKLSVTSRSNRIRNIRDFFNYFIDSDIIR